MKLFQYTFIDLITYVCRDVNFIGTFEAAAAISTFSEPAKWMDASLKGLQNQIVSLK